MATGVDLRAPVPFLARLFYNEKQPIMNTREMVEQAIMFGTITAVVAKCLGSNCGVNPLAAASYGALRGIVDQPSAQRIYQLTEKKHEMENSSKILHIMAQYVLLMTAFWTVQKVAALSVKISTFVLSKMTSRISPKAMPTISYGNIGLLEGSLFVIGVLNGLAGAHFKNKSKDRN
jgi:hypothetical protein